MGQIQSFDCAFIYGSLVLFILVLLLWYGWISFFIKRRYWQELPYLICMFSSASSSKKKKRERGRIHISAVSCLRWTERPEPLCKEIILRCSQLLFFTGLLPFGDQWQTRIIWKTWQAYRMPWNIKGHWNDGFLLHN